MDHEVKEESKVPFEEEVVVQFPDDLDFLLFPIDGFEDVLVLRRLESMKYLIVFLHWLSLRLDFLRHLGVLLEVPDHQILLQVEVVQA